MAQARLDVQVTGNATGALRAISAVRAAGDEFANKFREQSKEAVGQIVHMVNPIILATTAIVAGVAKIGEAIRTHFEEGRQAVKKAGEELDKAAQSAGMTAQAYQALRTQAELAGKSLDEFNEALAAIKEGKATVSEMLTDWQALPGAISRSANAVKTLQFEAQATINRRAEESAAYHRNESGLTARARFVGEAQARILAGEDYATVVRELIDKYSRGDWYTLGFTDNSGELIGAQNDLRRWLREMEAQRADDDTAQRERERAEEAREDAAEAERRRQEAESDTASRSREWQAITAAGGVEAYAVGLVRRTRPNAGLDDEQVQYLIRALGPRFAALEAEFGEDAVTRLAKEFVAEQKKAEADVEAKRKAEKKAEDDATKQKIADEKRKQDIRDIKEWARLAREEAEGSYRGGYANNFGLAFGAGDLIGTGRYRAVTRMTEAQRLLHVNEQVLEINKQMNEKLKALEEG